MRVAPLEKLVFACLCAARRTNKSPRLWNVSQTFQLDKMNNKKGCAAIRLVHLLDPVGKGFFKGLWDRHLPTNWDFAYGFSKGKRRETAIVHQRSLRHSLKSRGCSVHTGFYDVANAFPSPSHEAIDCMLRTMCPAADVALLQNRYRDALMSVTCAEGHRLVLSVGSGTLQGDAAAPEQFAELYNPVIQEWQCDTSRPDHQSLVTAVYPLTGEIVRVDVSCYADDVARTCVASEPHELVHTEARWDSALDARLASVGMGQNHGKKEWLLRFVGKHACSKMRKSLGFRSKLVGKPKLVARYLGAWEDADGCFQVDVSKRLCAAQNAWHAMAGWFKARSAPLATRVAVFKSLVLGFAAFRFGGLGPNRHGLHET